MDLRDTNFAGGMLGVRDYCTDGNQSLSTFSNLIAKEFVNPSLGFLSVSNGAFQMAVRGDAGADYSIYTSTNLAFPVWSLLLTTNPSTLPFLFTDSASANFAQRFYRVTLGP